MIHIVSLISDNCGFIEERTFKMYYNVYTFLRLKSDTKKGVIHLTEPLFYVELFS